METSRESVGIQVGPAAPDGRTTQGGDSETRRRLGVLLADEDKACRNDLRALLEAEGWGVVGEASDGAEALRLARALQPHVAILALELPPLRGIQIARELHLEAPVTRPVLLMTRADDRDISEAVRLGIWGLLLKSQAAVDLVPAIREVSRGAIYLSPGISRAVVEAYLVRTALPLDPLTRRERQVLQLVAEGKRTKEIAALLGVSLKTAESHRGRLMRKLGIHDTAGLVRYAIRRGLIQP